LINPHSSDTKASPLGKTSEYVSTYTPTLLYPIPRVINRSELKITDKLPFHGVDIWNAYEISWLNEKGKPQIAVGEFYIPCDSSHLIESKSFKLYLNSLNQSQFSDQGSVEKTLQQDLSLACRVQVTVKLKSISDFTDQSIVGFPGQCLDDLDVTISTYQTNKADLTTQDQSIKESVHSHLLKSNCPVTGQPDWGSVVIHYAGMKIDHRGLLKYIISFRNHQEFHEMCVERIFMDILNQCEPKALTVYGRYTRRGGLDINPFRSNFEKVYPNQRLARQ